MGSNFEEMYAKINIVGKGSFGLVWRGKRKIDGTLIAIKEISITQLSDSEYNVVCSETKILARVKHPNVIKYYGSYESDSVVSIVMEFASSGSLHQFLTQRNGEILEEEEVLHLITQLVLGLHYLHSNNILHRDLKPRNVLLVRREKNMSTHKFTAKISDFGLSKVLASHTDASSVLGTLSYSAPETCSGQPFTDRSDVWALGCILYEMLTLEKAFDASTLAAVVMKIMKGGVKPITNRSCSVPLTQLVNALLHQAPKERPSTSALMAHPYIAPVVFSIHAFLGCDS